MDENYILPRLKGLQDIYTEHALKECFDGFDKYFIPFISPNQKGHFSTREKKDVLPENNQWNVLAVPQILDEPGGGFYRAQLRSLRDYGYKEVNLNLGCPSRTVVTKGQRSRDFLDEPDRSWIVFWMRFLRNVNLEDLNQNKNRNGMIRRNLRRSFLKIYNKYPLEGADHSSAACRRSSIRTHPSLIHMPWAVEHSQTSALL